MRQLLILMFLVSCGPGVQGTSTDTTASSLVSKTTSAITQTSIDAKLVDTVDKLPACNQTSFGDLIYVRELAEFQYCDDSTNEWTTIDLKGPQGAQGIAGSKGNNGIKGSDGTTAKPLEDTEWIDPITNLEWIVGQKAFMQYADSTVLCASGSTLATEDEFQSAYMSGMFIKFAKYISKDNAGDCSFIASSTSCFESNGGVTDFSQADLKEGSAYILCVIAQ